MGSNAQGRQVLPDNVKPVHYTLTVEPDFSTFTYLGTVEIELDVKQDSNSISLNVNDIEIHETTLQVDGTPVSSAPSLSHNAETQTTTIDLTGGAQLKAGQKALLKHRFTGSLNDKMAGFYRSSWSKDGQEHFIASTQFEATDARRAFPCFDEPALKATFTVTLIADKEKTCLSNMDVAREVEVDSTITPGTKRKAVTFHKSPIMSTYLVAFIVGDLEYYETNKFRLPIRTYCTPDQDISHGVYAAELAAKTLEFYEKEFGIPYPLPKLDMVAVPDFSAGAMENWGLVTYRVVAVLLDEKTSSSGTRYRLAETVQHELAHQWFGNLVTMDFWEGLWLNEGFATWMSWYSCNAFYPEWKVWDGYVSDSWASALALDSLRSSHPIEVPVKVADEINQIFDDISYAKGSAVIRMISKWLGEDVFMEGIRNYLKKHAYGNTTTNDLWAALSAASGKDVENVGTIWTKKIGFPVLTVTEDAASNTIHVKQNRFLRTADVKPEEDEVLYPVFLGLRTKDGVNHDLALNTREASFKLDDLDFFKLNSEHSGIYRTLYTPERLKKLGQAAKSGLLPVSDRSGMVADAGALTQAGYQKTSGLLNLLQSLDSEPEFQVWGEIIGRIGTLQTAWLFEGDAIYNAIKSFLRALVSKRANELGWTFTGKEGHIEQQFKTLMFGAACGSDDKKATAAAQEMFSKFKGGDREAINPNLRRIVFATAIRLGGVEEYEAVLKEYQTAKTGSERIAALSSLGAADDPALVQRTLDYALSKEVKNQDMYLILGGLRRKPAQINTLWAWVKEHWEQLRELFPTSIGMIGTILHIGTTSFTKEEQRKDVEAFFEKHTTKGIDMDLAQALDAIKVKQGWLERDSADVENWLKQNGYLA